MSTTNIGTLHVIRHAESVHNIGSDKNIPDPELPPKGLQQAKELHDTFPYNRYRGDILIVSHGGFLALLMRDKGFAVSGAR